MDNYIQGDTPQQRQQSFDDFMAKLKDIEDAQESLSWITLLVMNNILLGLCALCCYYLVPMAEDSFKSTGEHISTAAHL